MRRSSGEFRVIAPDMRGFGWSGWPADGDFRKQRVADDALALLDALGLERVRLVGHDWGGWAAILAALTAPERVLEPARAGRSPTRGCRASLAPRNAYRLAYMLPLSGTRRAACRARSSRPRGATVSAGRRPSSTPTSRRCRRTRHARLYRTFLTHELDAAATGRSTVPARLMVGRREPLGHYIATNFPGEVEIVEGVGHFVPEEAGARRRAHPRLQAAAGAALKRSRASSRVIARLPQRTSSA